MPGSCTDDAETGRHGDAETRRYGDTETRKQGEEETGERIVRLDSAPRLRVSASRRRGKSRAMRIDSLLWLVPVLPAAGALINGVRAALDPHGPKNKSVTNVVALGTTFLSAVIATIVVFSYVGHGIHHPYEVVYYDWIPAGIGQVSGNLLANFNIELGFQVDTLSAT